jgi:excisionase family DNA binding protein
MPHKPIAAPDQMLSVAEAAAYLSVSTKTLRTMLADGRLQAFTLGARVLRIRKSDIDAALSPYGEQHAS